MILGIGIDTVAIQRFAHWHTYSAHKLQRILSKQEIEYCLAVPIKSSERFAARFAAREALCKALSAVYPDNQLSLLSIAHAACVAHAANNSPYFVINWALLPAIHPPYPIIHLSLTHTAEHATALVISSKSP